MYCASDGTRRVGRCAVPFSFSRVRRKPRTRSPAYAALRIYFNVSLWLSTSVLYKNSTSLPAKSRNCPSVSG